MACDQGGAPAGSYQELAPRSQGPQPVWPWEESGTRHLRSLARVRKRRSILCHSDWPIQRANHNFRPNSRYPWGPYLDSVATALCGWAAHQFAIKLRPRPCDLRTPLSAGSGGPDPCRLGQIEVGWVQAERGRPRVLSHHTAAGRHPQQQQ